ncbi:hypothetical protein M758_1G167300 [Ceratodon purpureus]|nr:hypothetical protein M758_1G167300 [Ceratodon purpureus]KAG0630277.1 hypothetical protein M758_1G167300 [Ceratodon purpureus]KAG0630278.1 hypothetical protein M758_1G167300 [Ceratodon purpureus]KAG0630280.1 hypothetical protein M758_1G167300 [Ceratodon purpureus]
MFALRNRAAGLALRAPELCNGGARMSTRALGPDEWWAVDGEILRIRPDFSKGYTRVNMKEPDPRPKPLNYRKLFADRMTRMSLIRIRDNSQEGYWDSYMERFNQTREEWEKLYWDGAPRAPDQDPIAMRPIDHYQILGLRKYVVFYLIIFYLSKNWEGDDWIMKITMGGLFGYLLALMP